MSDKNRHVAYKYDGRVARLPASESDRSSEVFKVLTRGGGGGRGDRGCWSVGM